jgi:hypothetical protein
MRFALGFCLGGGLTAAVALPRWGEVPAPPPVLNRLSRLSRAELVRLHCRLDDAEAAKAKALRDAAELWAVVADLRARLDAVRRGWVPPAAGTLDVPEPDRIPAPAVPIPVPTHPGD